MKKAGINYLLAIGLLLTFNACKDKPEETKEVPAAAPKLKEENVSYKLDTITMNGYVVYDENSDKKRPAVLVVHEWWGLNDYPKMRAKQLAELGYIAFAVDMYGNGTVVDNPEAAMKMAGPFGQNPQMAKDRFDAAMRKIKENPITDTNNIAAIGYCFGGGLLLNVVRMGEDIDGVVSFHGGLVGTPFKKELVKSKVLVCHGEADSFIPQADLDNFKTQMDGIGNDWGMKVYPNATHAFTNPDATEVGKKFNIPIAYNAAADSASWQDMKDFLGKIFK